jgi:hypothetical protein
VVEEAGTEVGRAHTPGRVALPAAPRL